MEYGIQKDVVEKFTNHFNTNIKNLELFSDNNYEFFTDVIKTQKFNAIFHGLLKKYVEKHNNLLNSFQLCEKFFAPIFLLLLLCALCYMVFIAFVIIVVSKI